jgi:membrane-associated protease RseP (regulator of RpoE activity)
MQTCSFRHDAILFPILLVATCFLSTVGVCQESSNVALQVNGRVVEVFRSASSDKEFLVQMLVQRSEAIRIADLDSGTLFPAPGEYLYIHVGATDNSGREAAILPRPGMDILANLLAGDHQQWIGPKGVWFQETGGVEIATPANGGLGVTTEEVALRFRRALKVTAVDANSPAFRAGLEVGDVLVSANGVDVSSPAELAGEVRKTRGVLKLTVRDIRTDKNVPVEVDLSGQGSDMRQPARNANRSSGLKTEVAFFGGNAALKVTSVAAGSPAQRAGIEPGLLILSANGKPVENPESLASVAAESRGILELKTFEPKTREEGTIQVDLR